MKWLVAFGGSIFHDKLFENVQFLKVKSLTPDRDVKNNYHKMIFFTKRFSNRYSLDIPTTLGRAAT